MAAGDITDQLSSELSLRLEDADEVKFTSVFKLEALNKAQIQLAQLLHNAYLTELEEVATDVDISSGEYALSSLNSGNGVLRGAEGILKCSVDVGAGGIDKWGIRIDIKDVKRTENTYLAGTDSNILFYVFDAKIIFLITTYTATTATIYFLKMPAVMTTDVDPELNVSLHPLIVDLAEALCWSIDSKLDRRTAILNSALQEIAVLNEKYAPSEGIGTNNIPR